MFLQMFEVMKTLPGVALNWKNHDVMGVDEVEKAVQLNIVNLAGSVVGFPHLKALVNRAMMGNLGNLGHMEKAEQAEKEVNNNIQITNTNMHQFN